MRQRDDHHLGQGTGGAIAWPASLARAEATIVRRPRAWRRFEPVVDLGEAIGSPRWCRGVVTLTAMVAALLHVAPGAPVLPGIAPHASAAATSGVAGGPVQIDRAPMPDARPIPVGGQLRLTGTAGPSLYRSLRQAGAAPSVAADYIRAVAPRVDIGDIAPSDRFDLVVGHDPAAADGGTDGRLLYAGIVHLGHPLGLMRWALGHGEAWFDAAGTGVSSDGFTVPVADARLSSGFGMRFHPILGFSRMHQGVDLAAPLGTPIVAAAEGIVRFAGWHGGYGNFVQIQHDGGMGTGYGHMSAFVVRPGEAVRQGELIGYVGSTGMSTGPHCHFEVYQNGVAVDPQTAQFAVAPQLGGNSLGRFRATLAGLVALPVT